MNKEYETPYFVLDYDVLDTEVCLLQRAISTFWPNTIAAYSVKTNSLPYLAKILNNKGLYAEVVSKDEYELVRLCGYKPSHIVCNGPVKSRDFVNELMDNNVTINIDSHRELQYVADYSKQHPIRECKVGLRVNLDVEHHFPQESKAGEYGSRFGFCIDNGELGNAISFLRKCDNIYINGLHLHISTSTRRIEIYEWLAETFCSLVKDFSLDHIEYFDIGGGFFGGIPEKPNWNDYISSIGKILHKQGYASNNLTLILEPGVSLLAGAFSYYTSVIDVKKTNSSIFVVTDGSRTHIDPLFHKTTYIYDHIQKQQTQNSNQQIIAGCTCLEYDYIMKLCDKPLAVEGDVFRFDKLGAYTMTLSPLFISYFPPVYIRYSNGDMICARERWTAKEFSQKSFL